MITWPRSPGFERFSAGAWRALGPWCVRQFQRGAVALVGAFLGGVLVWVMASDVRETHEQAQLALEAVQAQMPSSGVTTALPDLLDPLAQAAGPLWTRLPGRLAADVGTELRQFLMAKGMQVASLRAMPDGMRGALQSKTVAIRMTGTYADWTKAWQTLMDFGPVVSMERMSVVPLASAPGVQLDVVLRVWFRPDATQVLTWPSGERWGSRIGDVSHADAGIFALTANQEGRPSLAPETRLALSDDPSRWPVERIRLLGTWQQGTRWRAVLGTDAVWVPVQVGQRVSQEGHKVAAIRREGVLLRTPQGQQVELGWAGGGR